MSGHGSLRAAGRLTLLLVATSAPTCDGEELDTTSSAPSSCSQTPPYAPYKCIAVQAAGGSFCANMVDGTDTLAVCYSCMLHEDAQPVPAYTCYDDIESARNSQCSQSSSIIRCEKD